MKSLITGASGFVGSAVLRCLLNAGHEVRAMVRPQSDRRNLQGLQVEIVEGDLNNRESLQHAVRGCDFLFHVAADYRLWIPDPDVIYRTNVEGSRNLIQAAAGAGVKKIVYTSSVATLGLNNTRVPADEETPVSLENMVGHYKRSKYLAEQAVLELVHNDVPIIIVNPSTPVGPRDIKPTPTGRIIVDMLCGRMPAYVDTGLNIAHVDDIARGHLLAFEYGEIGERYILGGENLSLKFILDMIAEIADIKSPKIRLPHNLVLPIAWLAERWADFTDKEPFATVDGVKMAKKYMYFSTAKAKAKLGYNPRPAREGIEAAVKWFIENGYSR